MAMEMAEIHALDTTHFQFLPPKDVSLPPEKAGVAYSGAEIESRDFLKMIWPLSPKNPPRLTHGDFWPGNILWQDGRLATVLDWEQAGICDPLYDLAVTHLDILWLFGLPPQTLTGGPRKIDPASGARDSFLFRWSDIAISLRMR